MNPKTVEEKHIRAAGVEAMSRKATPQQKPGSDNPPPDAYNAHHGWRTV
jgi:hypothetical protein